ncbi:MAG: flagellar export chaperone FliS [Bacillota bacterium]|nr:flagellar export chaperone FliS [Bacillota bacterium]
MNMPNPYQQYRVNNILTADPGRLALMVFTEAAKVTRQAAEALGRADTVTAHRGLLRAQELVSYLVETVDTSLEVGQGLAALYDYFHRRLVEANVGKDREIAEEVAGMLDELRGTWEQALGKQGASPAPAGTPGGE